VVLQIAWEEQDASSIFYGNIDGAVVYERTQGHGNFVFYCRFSDVAFWQRREPSEGRMSSWKRGPCFIPVPDDEWKRPDDGESIKIRDLINENYDSSGVYDALLDALVTPDDFSVIREHSNWVSWKGQEEDFHTGPQFKEFMARSKAEMIRYAKEHNQEIYSAFMRAYREELTGALTYAGRLVIAEKNLEKLAGIKFLAEWETQSEWRQWIEGLLTDEIDTSQKVLDKERGSVLKAALQTPKRSKQSQRENYPYKCNDLATLLKGWGYTEQRIRQRISRAEKKGECATIESVTIQTKKFSPRERGIASSSYEERK
jgi:hypothetical protein